MFSVILAASNAGSYITHEMSRGDALLYGLKITALGMLVVFSVLALIMVILLLSKLIFTAKRSKGAALPVIKPQASVVPAQADASPALASAECEEDESEILAVITAAIAASTGAKPDSFRVVSFKRR